MSEKEQSNEMEVEENGISGASNAEAGEAPMEVGTASSASNADSAVTQNNSVRIMASSGTVGSVSISLHPLVIMNVSEHWTRLRAQEGSDQLGNCTLV